MAKSKRAKVVHLSKTEKKGREIKGKLIEQIREASSTYPHIYLFRVKNMRNILFKALRARTDGRFFIGKNKVMSVALGSEESSECVPGAHLIAKRLRGDLGVFFANETPEKVEELFESAEEIDFGRTGVKVETTVVVDADPQGLRNFETNELLPATVEQQLRDAGMPTKLRGGIILLNSDRFVICEEGRRITSDQARILKIMGIKLASFKVLLVAHLFDGRFEEFEDSIDEDEESANVDEQETLSSMEEGDEEESRY